MKDTAEHRVDAGVVIRDARPEEYEAIGEITVAAYLADGYLEEDDYYTETLRDARRRAEHADVITAVDAVTERVLGAVAFCLPGTAYAELSGDGEAEFRMLAVDPAARGRGIGDSLVQACLYRARQQGCTAVVISSLATMRAAHRIYARNGFVRAPERDWEPMPGFELDCYRCPL